MNQKFYSLNPQFYLYLWNKDTNLSLHANKNLKNREFEHKLKKALSGWHDHLLFDPAFLENKHFNLYIKKTLEHNIKPTLQITQAYFDKYKDQIQAFSNTYKSQLNFHFIFNDSLKIPFKKLTALASPCSLVCVITKENKKTFLKHNLSKEWLSKTWLYFPYKKHLLDLFLTPRQVYKLISNQPKLPVYPVEIYDSRIPQDMDLEPYILPFAKNELPKRNIYFSIIIPSYNSKTELINTLKHLAEQDFPRDEYEITAVDDGSADEYKTIPKRLCCATPQFKYKSHTLPKSDRKKIWRLPFSRGLS